VPSLVIRQFRLIVNARDERGHRAHVHVLKGQTKVQITLDASLTPYKSKDMSDRDISTARELVAEHFAQLSAWWMEYNE
jgi:hypothetical protein